MIGKKVANPDKSATKRTRISALLEYMRQPEDHNGTEKCLHFGTRNFRSQDFNAQIAEMVFLAVGATRSPDPLVHYVLSWRNGERPTQAQVDAAIATLQEQLEIEHLLLAYSLHADTEHWHVHLAVLRVDPDTGRPVQIHRGFDIDALQRAVALIEHEQGWQVEANKRWKVEQGRTVPVDPEPPSPNRPNRPLRPKAKRQPRSPQRRRDASHRTGVPSVIEQAIEALAPAIRDTRTWPQLHAALRAQGARYDLAANQQGGVITWQGQTFKASAIDRGVSLRALERRYGQPYTPPQPDPAAGVARSTPLHPHRAWQLIEPARDLGRGWQPIHDALAPHGLVYEEAGTGARISSVHNPDWTVTASRAHRLASRMHLEQALRPYQPAGPQATATLARFTEQVTERIANETSNNVTDKTSKGTVNGTSAQPGLPDFGVAAAIIGAVRSWRELHRRLAAKGFRYDRKGSGATLTHGAFTLKASSVSRKISLGALQRRLGPYEPSTEPAPDHTASAAEGTDPERDAYERQRAVERAERDAARLADDARHDEELAELKARQAAERTKTLAGDWTGRGKELNRRRSELAAKHRDERQQLAARRRLAGKERARNSPQLPPFDTWQRTPTLDVDVRSQITVPRPVDVIGFAGVQRRNHVDYIRLDDPNRRVAFRDDGRTIRVHQSRNEQTVLAALRVAQSRSRGRPIVVRGGQRFRELARGLANKHGIAIVEARTRKRTPASSSAGPRPEAQTPGPASNEVPERPQPSALPEPPSHTSKSPSPDDDLEAQQDTAPKPDRIRDPDRQRLELILLPALLPCDANGVARTEDPDAGPPTEHPPALAAYTAQRLGGGRFVAYSRTDANGGQIPIGCDAGSTIVPTHNASTADLRALLQAAADRWTHVRSQRQSPDSTISRIGETRHDQYINALRHVAAEHEIAALVWPRPQFIAGGGQQWDNAPWREHVRQPGGPQNVGCVDRS